MKNTFKIVESEEGRVFYILKYIKSDGSDTVICVTKHHDDLYIEFNDIINIIDYKVCTVKIYRRMDMTGVKYFKQPSGDSGTYEFDTQFISIDNVRKWLTGSTKPEAKPLFKFLTYGVATKKDQFENFTKPEPEESGWNFTPYKDKNEDEGDDKDDDIPEPINVTRMAEEILSDNRMKDLLIQLIKEYLSK